MSKRFLLFQGQVYYAAGGWNDLKGCFDTVEEAKTSMPAKSTFTWSHIVDTTTGEIVFEDGQPQSGF